MELKEYIKIIKSGTKTIIAAGILVSLFAFLFSFFQQASYEAYLSLFINKDKTQQTDDFKYDGYYALLSSELIASSIEQLMRSPEFVNSVYKKAEINSDFENIKEYSKKFTANKMSSQYIEVKFKTDKREEAEKISSAIVKEINDRTKELAENSEEEISFSVSGNNPVILEKKSEIAANSIIGLFSGLLLGLFIVFGKEYFS